MFFMFFQESWNQRLLTKSKKQPNTQRNLGRCGYVINVEKCNLIPKQETFEQYVFKLLAFARRKNVHIGVLLLMG